MAIRQLSIFLENKKGRLESIAKLLADGNIDIRGISVADTAEFGLLRLIVNDIDKAQKILEANSVALHINDVTAVEIDRKPGGLARVLGVLNDTAINVEYMYALAQPNSINPVLILRFSEPKTAREMLRNAGFKLLDERDFEA